MSVERGADVIYSRDVDERILEIESDLEQDDEGEFPLSEDADEREQLRDELTEELNRLLTFKNDASNEEWDYGQVFIHVSFFEDYVQEMVVDIGDLPSEIPYYIEIDWEATAENVRQDYTFVDFDGEEYLTR